MRKFVPLFLLLLLCFPAVSAAHPGRTDADGGHYDRSTGEYHYHHGYPAHQHTDGICPYDYDDQTGSNSGSSSGDNTGYIPSAVVDSSYSDGYDDGYIHGYNDGYDSGSDDGYEQATVQKDEEYFPSFSSFHSHTNCLRYHWHPSHPPQILCPKGFSPTGKQ